MNYRPEIDGLRALAVVPVILFHAGFQFFSGGFVGVDIFFVISGYLITSIILTEKQAGTFTIVNFYERRARRILPALFFVMIACVPFAWLWLTPNDLRYFSQSVVAVSIFSSNVLFWLRSGYFDVASELKPLLHTWSLAVEEQYYVLFPLFLIITWRLGRRWILAILLAIAVVSLAAAQWGSTKDPEAAFYLLPTRGWELLIGAFAAFYFASEHRWRPSKSLSEAGGLIGLLLLIVSILALDKQTPFPSLYTLLPTIGTVLIILFASQQSLVGKLLGNRLFVGIGLISYSAYLWHQPLFAFGKYRSDSELSSLTLLAFSLAAMLLGYISWRFIEKPFRNRKLITRNQIFAASFVISIGFFAAGYFLQAQSIPTIAHLQNKENWLFSIDYDDLQKAATVITDELAAPDVEGTFEQDRFKVLVIGDSLANDFVSAAKMSEKVRDRFSVMHLDYDDRCFAKGFSAECDQERETLAQSQLLKDADIVVVTVSFERETDVQNFLQEYEDFKKKFHIILPAAFNDPRSLKTVSSDLPSRSQHAAFSNIYAQNKFEAQLAISKDVAGILQQQGISYSDGYHIYCRDKDLDCPLFDQKGDILMFDSLHKTESGLVYYSSRVEDWLFNSFVK